MSTSDITSMSIYQLNDVLANYELFEPNEIKMAAKMKIKLIKQSRVKLFYELELIKMQYRTRRSMTEYELKARIVK